MSRSERPIWCTARFAAALCAAFPLVLHFVPSVGTGAENAQRPGKFERGVLIRLEGPISPLSERYLLRKLDTAEDRRADLVIIEIDSPGGFLESSLKIAERLRDVDWAHTVAFVPNQALSGAAIVALACDDIIMAPAARLGDAGPIIQGEDSLFRHAPEKIRSELVGRLQDLARAKGRPPALAAAMADMDLVVYQVRNKQTNAETYMSEEEISSSDDPAAWEKIKPVPESRPEYFLSVNGERAVELTLAQGNAATRDELKARYQVAHDLLVLRPSGVDTAVTLLNLPLVTGLLFVIGLVALYIEFSAPGLGLGGLIAATLLCPVLLEPLSRWNGRLAGGNPVRRWGGLPGDGGIRDPRLRHRRPDRTAAGLHEHPDGKPALCDSADGPAAGHVVELDRGTCHLGRCVSDRGRGAQSLLSDAACGPLADARDS